MSVRFGRAVKLRLGDLEISNIVKTVRDPQLGVAFNITRSTNREPNKAEVRVLNLAERSRSQFSDERAVAVSLSAGHLNDNISLLYQGDLRFSATVNQGVNWVTSFSTGDGSKAAKTARINKSFKRAKPADLLRELGDVLGAAGIGPGNIQDKINEGGIVAGLNEYLGGVVLSGLAVDVMTQVITSLGYEWSIQDEQIQILRPNETTSDTILKINPSSGLIGSPQVGKKGLVKFRILLDGRAKPGGPINLEAKNFPAGNLRIEKAQHTGDTWGDDWFSDIEAKPVKAA